MEIKDIIRGLVQQCNIESINTKDLTHELSNLYDSVQRLERELKETKKYYEQESKDRREIEKDLEKYKAKYVTPVEDVRKEKEELEKEKFKFTVEKVYMVREVQIYRETLAALTSRHHSYESYNKYSSDGSNENRSYGLNVDKPNLPGQPNFDPPKNNR